MWQSVSTGSGACLRVGVFLAPIHRSMMRLSLIGQCSCVLGLFVASALFCASSAAAEAPQGRRFPLRLRLALDDRTLPRKIDLLTPLGRDRIVLDRIAPFSYRGARTAENGHPVVDDKRHAALWRGTASLQSSAGSPRRVALDQIGDSLRLVIPKRRYGGFFVVRLNVRTGAARVTRVPGAAAARCGHQTAALSSLPSLVAGATTRALVVPQTAAAAATPVAIYQPARELEVALDADAEFSTTYGAATLAEMEAILNAAATIYLDQFAIRVSLVATNIFTTGNSPYVRRTSSALLDEFRAYTLTNGHLGQADLYHLLTGVNLEDNTVGLAFVGVACTENGDYSFGLSQRTGSATHFLITAHELGHNLGANHPEEKLSPAPRASLMTGVVTASNTKFSEYSRAEITRFIRRSGSCLATEARSVSLTAARKVNRYTFSVGIDPTFGESCRFSVYGATTQASLRRSLSGGSLLGTKNVTADATASVSASRGTNRNEYFVRVVVRCADGQDVPSRIVRVTGGNTLRRALARALRL